MVQELLPTALARLASSFCCSALNFSASCSFMNHDSAYTILAMSTARTTAILVSFRMCFFAKKRRCRDQNVAAAVFMRASIVGES